MGQFKCQRTIVATNQLSLETVYNKKVRIAGRISCCIIKPNKMPHFRNLLELWLTENNEKIFKSENAKYVRTVVAPACPMHSFSLSVKSVISAFSWNGFRVALMAKKVSQLRSHSHLVIVHHTTTNFLLLFGASIASQLYRFIVYNL